MANKKAMDALLQKFVQEGPAGCGCIVTKDGERIYENYFGVSDPTTGKPTDADSVYRLFSSTKVIICTAAMKLFEEGKFLLNDPIYEYFPEWRGTQKVVYHPSGNYTVVPVDEPILVKHAFSMACGIEIAAGLIVSLMRWMRVCPESQKSWKVCSRARRFRRVARRRFLETI